LHAPPLLHLGADHWITVQVDAFCLALALRFKTSPKLYPGYRMAEVPACASETMPDFGIGADGIIRHQPNTAAEKADVEMFAPPNNTV
jgi:hypothetical protein